jgi:hypothetical protein
LIQATAFVGVFLAELVTVGLAWSLALAQIANDGSGTAG